jgi:hypothetical protein
VEKPEDLLKEPLVLEFLGLSEQTRYAESDLETAIINQIERFLLELGKGFLFEARQKRFRLSFREYRGFPTQIFGGCEIFISPTTRMKNSHHWCEKLVGQKMS